MNVINLKNPTTNYITRSETLVRFYHDAVKYQMLSQEEEDELFSLYIKGNKDEKSFARERLINCNIRFVIAMAKKYGTSDNILDLINEGIIALNESIERFKPSVGTRFLSYAVWYIRRAINQYNVNYGSVVKKNNISKTYHVISKATNKFLQKEYRQPTLEELQDILINEYNVTIEDLNDILETRISSIDERYDDDDDTNVGDIILFNSNNSSFNSYEDTTNKDFNKKLLTSVLNTLNERDKNIIKLLYGIECEREYEINEVADMFDMTSERIRQLKHSIVDKLKSNAEKLLKRL